MKMNEERLIELFKSIGLDEKKAKETVKNKKLSAVLSLSIQQVNLIQAHRIIRVFHEIIFRLKNLT